MSATYREAKSFNDEQLIATYIFLRLLFYSLVSLYKIPNSLNFLI